MYQHSYHRYTHTHIYSSVLCEKQFHAATVSKHVKTFSECLLCLSPPRAASHRFHPSGLIVSRCYQTLCSRTQLSVPSLSFFEVCWGNCSLSQLWRSVVRCWNVPVRNVSMDMLTFKVSLARWSAAELKADRQQNILKKETRQCRAEFEYRSLRCPKLATVQKMPLLSGW